MAEKYLTLYHHNSNAKTLADFMEMSYIKQSVISVDDLFEMNRSAIFSQMSLDEKADYAESLGKDSITESDLKSDMTLPLPCTLKIEAKYVDYELAISQTNFQANTDDLYAFENEQIQGILQNEGYVIDRNTKKLAPECSVFGWFKSLYYAGGLDDLSSIFFRSTNNKFIDISDFIINVATNVNASGGTFSITLPIINSIEQLVKIKPWGDSNSPIMRTFSYSDRSAQQIDMYKYGKFFFHKGGMMAMDKNYFNWLIQSNDLIFISFEKLEMEKTLRKCIMPKMKSHSGLKKRLKRTGSGKLKRSHAYVSHLSHNKTHKQKKHLAKATVVSASDYKRIKSRLCK